MPGNMQEVLVYGNPQAMLEVPEDTDNVTEEVIMEDLEDNPEAEADHQEALAGLQAWTIRRWVHRGQLIMASNESRGRLGSSRTRWRLTTSISMTESSMVMSGDDASTATSLDVAHR